MISRIVCLVCLSLPGFGQVLHGLVLDSATQETLPSATIGIIGTTVGTASNQDGRFVLDVPQEFQDSILFVSYVGYKTSYFQISELGGSVMIQLVGEKLLLEEVEVRPWDPYDYILAALRKIPDNYMNGSFLTTNYYNEYIAEDGGFIKFTEGVIETFNPAYGDSARISSKLIQARTRDDLESIRFMRQRLEKKMTKAVKKAKKKGERIDFETLDDAVLSVSFGGPRRILHNDPIRENISFLNPEYRKYYEYSVEGYSTYHDMQVVIIHFKSTRKIDHEIKEGDVYITMDTDAIVSVEYETKMIIPDIARPVMFLYGLGATDPVVNMSIHYKPYRDRWFVNDISIIGGSNLTQKKMFKKNLHSSFELYQSMITTNVTFDNVRPFSKEERLQNWKPLEDQIESDPEFWKSYEVAYPALTK